MRFFSAWILLLAGAIYAPSLAARDYEFDRVHSNVGFAVSHLGFSMSQGRFKGISGDFSFHRKRWERSRCDVRIEVDSLDMGDAAWEKKLLGKDWFDAQSHPEMRFVCTRLEQSDDRGGTLHGKLSLRGVTRDVALDLTFNRAGLHKYSLHYVAGFSATTRIRRSEFGMDRLIPEIGDEILISIEIEGTMRKQP